MAISSSLPVIYAALWLMVFVCYYIYKRIFDLGALIITVYAGSAWASVYYYNITYVKPQYSLLEPAMYFLLFAGIFFCMLPYLKYRFHIPIEIDDFGYSQLSYYIAITLAILGMPTLIEHMYHVLSVGLGGTTYFGELYSGDVSAHAYLSWFSRKSNYILMKCQALVSVMFVYYALQRQYVLSFGLFCAFFSNLLAPYNAGSRGGIVFGLTSLVVTVMSLQGCFPRDLFKKSSRIMFIGLGCMMLVILMISVSRYNYNEDYSYRSSVWEWVALYVGEGSLRFANDLNSLTIYSEGCNVFGAFCENSYATEVEQDLFYLQTGVRVNVFYTFVGDFILDFGLQGAIWFCVTFYLISAFIFQKTTTLTLDVIILRVLLAQVLVLGFTSYPYRANLLEGVFAWPFIAAVSIYFARTTTAILWHKNTKLEEDK